MASIVSNPFANALTPDKGLSLANEEFVRKMSIGSNWTMLRIGVQCSWVTDCQTSLSSAAFVIGVCSGVTNTYTQATTTNFVGANLCGQSTTGSITANFNPPWYLTVSGACFLRRVGTSTTVTGGASFGTIFNGTALTKRSIYYLDITKGSPNYTLKLWGTVDGASFGAQEGTTAGFTGAISAATPAPAGSSALTSITSSAVACDETAGAFDSVSIFWNKTTYAVQICYLQLFRFS